MEDPPSFRFTWTIENFSRLNIKKLYSDIFFVGSYKWRVLIFPKGNNVDHLSVFLDVADSGSLPYGCSRYARFSLAVVNQVHSKYTIRKDTQHQFNSRESDWGFTSFMPLSDLYDPSRGYLVNDTLVVEAELVVHKVVDYWTYDSKKETGYVGLKNQGTTCYMNSLLQTLYHIPYFRKAVYHMPTTENDIPSGSIPLALQSLFFRLQYSDNSVATKELTKSFGWDTNDSFMQHDVQELNRVLCEKLEDKMKGTAAEGTIQQLFEGHHMNYIECINMDYESSHKEAFYDLQLDVKGCHDVYASFDKYVEVVRLEGDKKYHAEQYGLQDAKKGALFIDFPPVLQLQLKRFKYDFMMDTMVKINDRYEFPLQLDLDRDNGKYLSPDADRSVHNLYALHSVLVHSGGVHDGHYYAFIRPILSDQWFKFYDEHVTKEEMKRALEEQYGGEEELPQTNPGFNNTPFKFPKYSNAYMLVYIRESDKDKIICSVDEKDIAKHLRIILKKDQEEKKHKEIAEAHLYTIIKVARDEDLAGQIGKDIYFDLVDHDKVRNFRIKKQMLFKAFKEEVAKELGIPVQFQRFWLWAKRENHTYRPNRPLNPLEEAQSVGQLRNVSNKGHNAKLNLFLEVELGVSRPFFPPAKTKDDILLFFKLFDPVKEELRYVGRLFVKALGNPAEIITKLNEMAGFSPNEEIELYEEIRFEPSVMCDHIDKKLNFRSSQLEDGDIICYQKCSHGNNDQCGYPDVPSFLEYVHNRQHGEKETVGEGEDASSTFYFKWNDEMDACLTTSLIDQMEKEIKKERSFTNVTYNAICHLLEKTFGTKFTIEHVKHRLKTLEKQLAAFQDMQNSTSGFLFNKITKMMDAEPTIWDAYLKAHPNMKQYRYKSLPTFENLMIIFGNDQAIGHGSKTVKKQRIHMEREPKEMNINDQDPLLLVEKKSSIEHNEGSIKMQGDETTLSKLDYRPSTGKAYAKRKFEDFKEFQMLKSGMDVASAINLCAPRMIITEEQLFEEVRRVDGLSEFSKIVAYDFLCDEVTRGRKFIGLPLAYRKQWLEFKLGQPLE